MKTRAPSYSSSRSRSRSGGAAKAKSSRAKILRVSRARAPKAGGARAARRTTAKIGRTAEITIDRDEIQHWAEDRGGIPAVVKQTHRKGEGAEGILRIDFPGFGSDTKLERVSWDEWFGIFERHQLAFLCQKRKASGEQSTFNKLVSRSELV